MWPTKASKSAEERVRDTYERREKARRDIAAEVKQGKKEVARNLLSLGGPVDKVIAVTNLTREEVEALLTS